MAKVFNNMQQMFENSKPFSVSLLWKFYQRTILHEKNNVYYFKCSQIIVFCNTKHGKLYKWIKMGNFKTYKH